MLKVIITGAFSTGKTSLVASLADALISSGLTVARVPDVSRGCPVPLNRDQTDDASLWLLTTQISREIAASLGQEAVMLCDRGVPDVLAHHLEVQARNDDGKIRLLAPFLDNWLETYDLIFFSRLDEEIPIVPDGLRIEDAAYRTMLDGFAAEILSGRKQVYELPFGEAQRLDYARETVTRFLSSSRPTSDISNT
jgi:nicotinamide riboside kinase